MRGQVRLLDGLRQDAYHRDEGAVDRVFSGLGAVRLYLLAKPAIFAMSRRGRR